MFPFIRSRVFLLASAMLITLLFMQPSAVWAHASLTEASPEAGSAHLKSPEQVRLTFNERLENALFYVRVWDESGRDVTKEQAVMSQNHEQLTLALPELKEGVYTVSYKVISADGHPVRASYIFTVGDQALTPTLSDGHHHHDHGLLASLSSGTWLVYLTRIFYYTALLMLAGLLLWRVLLRRLAPQQQVWRQIDRPPVLALAIFSLALILQMIVQGREMLDRFDLSEWQEAAGTVAGSSWIAQIVLVALGFLVLRRRSWLDVTWVTALVLAKSVNGHASGADPRSVAVGLDALHLLASSLWVGGILLLVTCLIRERKDLPVLFPFVSRMALGAVIVLAVSGSLSTLLYVPSIRNLWDTEWGLLLTVKVALMMLAVLIGGWMRLRFRKQRRSPGALLRADAVVAALIIAIVGIFTYMSPQPANTPFMWHIMGEKMHLQAEISPGSPGNNHFLVTVWVWDSEEAPKQVKLLLHPRKGEDTGAIDVPLKPLGAVDDGSFIGFDAYTFEAEGSYLPFAGEWLVELRVVDGRDNETVQQKEIKLYDTERVGE